MSAFTNTDHLSLTLPDIKAEIKKRFKKPKNNTALFWIAWCISWGIYDLAKFFYTEQISCLFYFIAMMALLYYWWPLRNREEYNEKDANRLMGAFAVAMVFLVAGLVNA